MVFLNNVVPMHNALFKVLRSISVAFLSLHKPCVQFNVAASKEVVITANYSPSNTISVLANGIHQRFKLNEQ